MIIVGDLNIKTDVEHDSITVMWDAASSRYCGGIVYYLVELVSVVQRNRMTRTTTKLSVEFGNLEAETEYTVNVTAFNNAGGMTFIRNGIETGDNLYVI